MACVVIVAVVRDYDGQVFLRECNGGLLCSGYPPIAKPAYTEEIPVDLKANPLPEDWDYFSMSLYCVICICSNYTMLEKGSHRELSLELERTFVLPAE